MLDVRDSFFMLSSTSFGFTDTFLDQIFAASLENS